MSPRHTAGFPFVGPFRAALFLLASTPLAFGVPESVSAQSGAGVAAGVDASSAYASFSLGGPSVVSLPAVAPTPDEPWIAGPEVVPGGDGRMIRGVVFEDLDGDGRRAAQEPGVPGVLVSNGLDVVRTDGDGRYEVPVRPDMDLFVVQPAGWRVPTDQRLVPQFSYTHKPDGTTESLRFGGLPATGPAPAEVNFPLRRSHGGDRFTCGVLGDVQAYSGDEVGQFRISAVTDLVEMGLDSEDCLLYVGDVVGDDLALLDRIFEVGSAVGVPQWAVPGNHDLDLDATLEENAADTWRRIWGPAYYAFEQGQVTFIGLNNIVFPCGEADLALPGREFCVEDEGTRYNVRVAETQMQWLRNLVAQTPEDRLIVFFHHGPFVSFMDAASPIHQTDNAPEIHALVEGREALSLSGHTHTLENHAPGQHFQGWQENVGVGPLPFRHMVVGAVSGNWWQGDFNIDGDVQALQRMGAPKGVLMLEFQGSDYREWYHATRLGGQRAQWVELKTPAFREWFETLQAWRGTPARDRHPVPPLTVHDLPDPRLLTPEDLRAGVEVAANVWVGSAETRVEARINDGPSFELRRTQEGAGEGPRIGVDFADPFAAQRQLTVGRFAFQSRQGEARAQGYEAYRGRTFQGVAQPQTAVADRSMRLWKARLPEDLPEGVHVLTVTSTDRHGASATDHLIFEVRNERPARFWRHDVWEGRTPP